MPLARRMLMAASGAAANWWESGGASGVWAAYQPKSAASLAASYTDLSGNGNDASVGVAPTWNSTDGWIFNGSTQYLTTTFVPATDQSQAMLVQFTNGPTSGSRYIVGSNGVGSRSHFAFRVAVTGNWQAGNGEIETVGANVTSGNLGVSLKEAYLDGVAQGENILTYNSAGTAVYVGCRNNNGATANFAAVRIQALVIYDASLSDAEVAAVATAMAAL